MQALRTSFKEKIAGNRRQIELDLLFSSKRRYFSPIYYSQYEVTLPLMKRYVKGHLIDLGCGDLPFKTDLVNLVAKYDSLDIIPRREDVTYIADIQDMTVVSDEKYDSAICLEVLEHIPDPFQAVCEIYRILTPGGVLIMSVPHLSRLHDEPYDFYRYTKYGIRHLLEQAGFEVLLIQERGGLFSFLGHQVSTTLLGLTWNIPVVHNIVWFLNTWLVTRLCYQMDGKMNLSDYFTSGYTAVALK